MKIEGESLLSDVRRLPKPKRQINQFPKINYGMGPIESFIVKKALDACFNSARQMLASFGARIVSNESQLLESIQYHISDINTWAAEVSFADLRSAKFTSSIYIHLDCHVTPRNRRISPTEEIPTISFAELFSQDQTHAIILGTPGAGKTTSMKHLCHRVMREEGFANDRFRIPVLVRLRDLNRAKGDDFPLLQELASTLQLKIDFGTNLERDENRQAKEKFFVTVLGAFLEEIGALVVLDGLDEITLEDRRKQVLQEFRLLAARMTDSAIVITSRTGEFTAHVENAKTFEICPLNAGQIESFAYKWLNPVTKATDFLRQVKSSPFSDSAIKPLTLAHLCALYERVESIPDKPKTVYRKILNLLLSDWDEQRSVRRLSRYASFESDRKYEFLSRLSFELTTKSGGSSIFSSEEIKAIYNRVRVTFGLPLEEAEKVTEEIESHTGLFLQSGFREYEFAHKSLQEFLTAEYLVRLPQIPSSKSLLLRLPNELAIAVTISSDPSYYLTDLVLGRFATMKFGQTSYLTAFTTRLLQEKPDFTTNEYVLLALLVLYSLVLDNGSSNIETGQLSLFFFDNLVAEFDLLVRLLLKTNSKFKLAKYYKVSTRAYAVGGVDVYWFVRVPRKTRYPLPERIFVRQSFLDERLLGAGLALSPT